MKKTFIFSKNDNNSLGFLLENKKKIIINNNEINLLVSFLLRNGENILITKKQYIIELNNSTTYSFIELDGNKKVLTLGENIENKTPYFNLITLKEYTILKDILDKTKISKDIQLNLIIKK